eukprot:363986-Chlamydomonas_euryale.AAC.4
MPAGCLIPGGPRGQIHAMPSWQRMRLCTGAEIALLFSRSEPRATTLEAFPPRLEPTGCGRLRVPTHWTTHRTWSQTRRRGTDASFCARAFAVRAIPVRGPPCCGQGGGTQLPAGGTGMLCE